MSSLCQQNTSQISLCDTPADAKEQVLLSACRPPRWQEVPVIVLRFHVTVLFEQLHEFETHTQKTNYNIGIFWNQREAFHLYMQLSLRKLSGYKR